MSKYNFLIFNFSKVIFLLIFFFKFALAVTNTCKTNNKLSNTDCFTDIIKFDGDNYRAGHAVVTSNDELFIEYSLDKQSSNRLFYGLKKNGRNYFPDNSYVKLIDVGNDEGVYNRYESNNRIVKVVDSNTNTEKEYILSVSTFRTVVELYDIKTFDVKIKNSIKYFGHQIFSFEFPILEYKDNNEYIYFCAFSHYKNYKSNGLEYGEEKGFYVSLSKFKFNEHKFDVEQRKTVLVEDNKLNDRVITAYIIDELKYIGVVFIKEFDGEYKFIMRHYDFSLNQLKPDYVRFYNFGIKNLVEGKGIYFKAI